MVSKFSNLHASVDRVFKKSTRGEEEKYARKVNKMVNEDKKKLKRDKLASLSGGPHGLG